MTVPRLRGMGLRQRLLLYYLSSAASGVLWGGIAIVLMPRHFGPSLWPGVAFSPLIGFIVGCLIARLHALGTVSRCLVSLASSYVAVGMFAVAVTLGTSGVGVAEHFYESLMVLWIGLTVSGLVLVLWPLAFLNQVLLWRILKLSRSSHA